MDLTALCQPIDADTPCGPDLWDSMDPEFEEYYTSAQNRMPGFYVQPGVQRGDGSATPDKVFDPGSIRIAEEARQIDALLGRSRDLRLLALRARWEALAGRLPGVAQAVEAMAALIETFPEAVHPQATSDRRDAIGELNDGVTMVQALQFAPLNGSTEVTLRKLRVARGEMSPLQSEQDLDAGMLKDALAEPSRRAKVDESHAATRRLATALTRIERACLTSPTPFTPPLDALREVIGTILEAISEARPDLGSAESSPPVAVPGLAQPPQEIDAPTELIQPAILAPAAGAGPKVLDHSHARRLLEACEVYYRRNEPSSAALLVVAQARLLIGKPLLEALEVLLPERAAQAMIDFGPATGFALNAAQLKVLSATLPEGQPATPPADPAPVAPVTTAQDAANTIRAVEDYFRQTERSSPVPMLLQRARSYLNRDFQSLVDELIPQKTGR